MLMFALIELVDFKVAQQKANCKQSALFASILS